MFGTTPCLLAGGLFITTAETKTGVLLIETFKTPFNQLRVAISYFGLRAAKSPAENREAFLLLNVGACLTFCAHLTTGGLSGHQ